MLEEIRKEFTPLKFLVFLLIIAVSIYLLQALSQALGLFSDLILVVVIAWLLSFILEPVVNFCSRLLKLSKAWAAVLIYVLLGLGVSLMIFIYMPQINSQFQSLSKIVPQYFSAFPQLATGWNNFVKNSVDSFILFIPSIATIFVDAILVLFLSFYLVVDKENIIKEFYKLTPVNWHKNLQFIQKVIEDTFASFLQIQFIFGVISGILTWIVMILFRIDFSLSVALLAGILTIVPLVGPVLALIPPVFIAFATNPQNPGIAIFIFVILLILQQLVFNILGPKLMGKAFRLHPIIVLLSIILGFKIAGAFGAIFIIPILGILILVFKELGHYFVNPH